MWTYHLITLWETAFPVSPGKLVNHTAILQLIQVWLDQSKVHNISSNSWESPIEQAVYFHHCFFFSLNLNMHCQVLQDFEQINKLLKERWISIHHKIPNVNTNGHTESLWKSTSKTLKRKTDQSLAKVLFICNHCILIKTTGVSG